MANKLQQQTVASLVDQYATLQGLEPHKAFLFLVIDKYLNDLSLNAIDIEEAIIDGSNDCGIDAIVIDEENELNPRIYFFQSKYYTADNAFERNFEGDALDKIKSAVNDFVLQGKINTRYQNQRLVDKLHAIRNIQNKNPRYTIVLCSNSKEPTTDSSKRLEDFVQDSNSSSGGEYLSVEYIHLDRIVTEFIAPLQSTRIDLSLQISGKYLNEDNGNVRIFIGAVEGLDIAKMVDEYGDDLFERNIRGYLKKNNPINKNIINVATGDQSPYFLYMNNGLTITCENFTHNPVNQSPVLNITGAQIVNGQQTARSIHQSKLEGKLKEDVRALVRIVQTTDSDLLMDIVEATNSQTKVTSRDLHSNDEVQKLIEADLYTKGFFYESRKNKYQSKDGSKRVDAEVAAQAYYAIYEEQPALAKDKKKLIFGDKYDEIFNLEKIKPSDILLSFRLLKAVQRFNNDETYAREYSFLKDATLHTAALIYRISDLKNFLDVDDIESLETLYRKVVDAIATVVKEKVQEEGDKYEHRKTFKDVETFGRVVQILM
jgi:AIPR protein